MRWGGCGFSTLAQFQCCRCDSREPFTTVSHRIINVVSSIGPLRWWQSENGVDAVSLQFDLNKKFQLSDVTLDFRSPRPAGMLIERSSDSGKTWQVYQYLAFNCAASFPHIRQGRPQNLEDVRCQELQGNPTNGGKIRFSPMAMAFTVPISKSQQIHELGQFTNLRINFTQLTHLPVRGYRKPSAFYAVNEMRVHGSCFCYGHADHCVSDNEIGSVSFGDIQAHGRCACRHNTAGANCERCADLFNDLPWRPADDTNPNLCKRCNCNNHSDKCHFDPAVYEASGRVSGGVCEDCADGTTGQNCERCKPDYYRNPNQDISQRDACISCDCDPEGSVDGGSCDPMNGRCICKENVGGERCDQCKPEYYQLSAANPQGCTKCDCNTRGTQRDQPCDGETGQCRCLPNITGQHCDQCAIHHWNIASGRGCQMCGCHARNSYSLQCNQVTGQCLCRPGFGGQLCTECPDRTYGTLQSGCRECNCDFQGTLENGCDKATGRCLCRPGFVGERCDSCQRGYTNAFPNCKPCHSCFLFYDYELRALRTQMQTFRNITPGQVGKFDVDFGPRVSTVEAELQHIHRLCGGSGISDSELLGIENRLTKMREDMRQLNPDQPLVNSSGYLSADMNSLRLNINGVNELYQMKSTQYGNSISSNTLGLFSTVNTAYRSSLEAAERVAKAQTTVSQSREIRRGLNGLEGKTQDAVFDLEALKDELSYPNLTPTINRICEGVRTESCTPENCPGTVCHRNNTALCKVGSSCRGAFPLSMNALRNTEKTAKELLDLNSQLLKNTQMIKEAEKTSNEIKDSSQQLSEQVTWMRTRMEQDIGSTRQFIQQVRDFLTEPSTDPATIQEVSEYVLSLKLPVDASSLQRKMSEIRNIAGKLPNIDAVLSQTKDDIAKARKLQSEAEEARNKAISVEEDVDGVVDNIRKARKILQEAEDKIRGSSTLLLQIEDRMQEIEQVLGPVERGLTDVRDQLQVFTQRVERLQEKTAESLQQAGEARQAAEGAHRKATDAQQGLDAVQEKYALFKDRLRQASHVGGHGQKVTDIRMEADQLFKESEGMLRRMREIEGELRKGQQSVMNRMSELEGLEKEVIGLRDYIHAKAVSYATCRY
ncbi:laminin subunit beta-3 isoform X2 [Eleutherodactylus coqui]|uniref:laminin subunit beta-3 isoform X2 n=1 Tax=Eleutherodactylus coqui TaxID=57060 RepID=UPI003462285F